MKSRSNSKYYILIVAFTVIFFLCMVFCFTRFRTLSRDHKFRSLAYRKEAIELDERMYGPEHIYSSLYFAKDHEKAFDDYWKFSEAYLAYVRGRFSEEKASEIEVLQKYLDTAPGGEREKAVKGYLEELQKR